MHQYIIKCLFIQTKPTRALTDAGGAYHIWSSELTTDLSLTFPFGILHFPLVALPGVNLNHISTIHVLKHSIHEPGI
jgi:hypothetical protein